MSTRNYTQELLKAQREGAKIVVSLQPYAGREATYQPRSIHDSLPWVTEGAPYRFTGRECHAVTPNGNGPWSVARLLP
jgi:hypothetical protein